MILVLLQLYVTTWAGFLPNTTLTPGAVLSVTKAQICEAGYAGKVRHVTESTKKAVYAEYKIGTHKAGEYEIDHLISLELGGSNDIKNLWPQSYTTTPWNAHVKDILENRLHLLVCEGDVTLKEAQDEIRTDWVASYKIRIGRVYKNSFLVQRH